MIPKNFGHPGKSHENTKTPNISKNPKNSVLKPCSRYFPISCKFRFINFVARGRGIEKLLFVQLCWRLTQ